ncbi:MAG TPA: hypothetical protein VFB25_03945 [Gaiellaceae bacterium]|nr:hypothetical protein [Gaiellaceae bacterium]
MIGFMSHPTTQADQGLDVITIMLVTGLVFLLVVLLGELTKWAGHRRRDRKYGIHSQ